MALTRTCLQLETEARQRADEVGSAFRDTAAYKRYLSASCRRLVSKLQLLSDYWTATTTVNTVANTATSTFPTAAWKLLALRVTLNGERVRLDEASIDEIDIEVTPTGWSNGDVPRYRLRGELLHWVPIPTAVHVVTVEYLPTAIFKNNIGTAISEFAADTDTFDGVFGWEQWVVLDTAAKVLTDKGKADLAAALRVEQQAVEREIVLHATRREGDDAPKVRDTWRGGEETEDYS